MIVSHFLEWPQRRQNRLASAALFAVLAALTATSATAASMSASLSEDEQQFAANQAQVQPWLQNRRALFGSEHSLNVQTLSVELDERKKNKQQRRARVYQFNYNTQQSRLILVDLNTRETIQSQLIDSAHLPLNEQEIATARSLVEQHTDIMSRLNQELQSRGLPALNDLSNVDIKASIFEPKNDTHLCAKQRCALISLFDDSRTVFSVEPVVNLQQLSVTTLRQSL